MLPAREIDANGEGGHHEQPDAAAADDDVLSGRLRPWTYAPHDLDRQPDRAPALGRRDSDAGRLEARAVFRDQPESRLSQAALDPEGRPRRLARGQPAAALRRRLGDAPRAHP